MIERLAPRRSCWPPTSGRAARLWPRARRCSDTRTCNRISRAKGGRPGPKGSRHAGGDSPGWSGRLRTATSDGPGHLCIQRGKCTRISFLCDSERGRRPLIVSFCFHSPKCAWGWINWSTSLFASEWDFL